MVAESRKMAPQQGGANQKQGFFERNFTPGRMLFMFTVVNLINYLDRGILPGALVEIEATLNVKDTVGGLLQSKCKQCCY